jgi:hypothetical protein
MWQTPIHDRTEEDVRIAREAIQGWLADPDTAVVTNLKGCLNYGDLNRIEGNIRYIVDTWLAMGYVPSSIKHSTYDLNGLTLAARETANASARTQGKIAVKDNWGLVDILESDIRRIISNVTILRGHAPQSLSITLPPDHMKNYYEINEIEYIELMLDELIENIRSNYRYSATVISGDR